MKNWNPFRHIEPTTSLREILGNDAVKGRLEHFINEHMATADAVLIIWTAKDAIFAEMDGLSEAEIVGLLDITKHKIQHQGILK